MIRLCDLSERDKRSIDYLKECGGYCELTVDNDDSPIEKQADLTGDFDGGGSNSDQESHSNLPTFFIDQSNHRRRPLGSRVTFINRMVFPRVHIWLLGSYSNCIDATGF